MVKVLFVCSGNVFRSMSAKHCFEKYVKDKNIKNVFVDSAGISFSSLKKDSIRVEVVNQLKYFDIDVKNHKPKNISKVNLKKFDLIVSMGYNHQQFLKDKYNIKSHLFNQICYGVNYPVYDNCEILKKEHYKGFRGELYNIEIVRYIYHSTPFFVKNYKNYI